MNKRMKGLVVITVNLFILMMICGLWMHSIKEQRIQKSQSLQIKIFAGDADEQLLETKDVLSWFHEFYKGDVRKIPTYNLNLKRLEEYILSQSLVRKADIYLDAKNLLHADIYQRSPLMRVLDISGNQYYLDEDGYKIPVSNKYASRVLVATGQLARIEGKRWVAKEKIYYSSLVKIAKAIRNDTFVRSLVEQIDMDGNGEFTLIPKVGNEKIFLGNADLIEDKFERLKLFYKENMGRQGWNVYQLVNLKFKGQVIGKKIQQES
jgi:cell division protein FtsQ